MLRMHKRLIRNVLPTLVATVLSLSVLNLEPGVLGQGQYLRTELPGVSLNSQSHAPQVSTCLLEE